MKYLFAGCILLFSTVAAKAQTNFVKGCVITSTKDTLKGFVDYREKEHNPSSFKFKSNTGDKVQTFTADNASEINIEGKDIYQRFIVDVSQSKTEAAYLSVGIDLTVRRDTVFLQVLQKGTNVTLYRYSNDIKNRFYIKERDVAEPIELIRNLYLDPNNTTVIKSSNSYSNQLMQLFTKYHANISAPGRKFTYLDYSERDIEKIVADINGDVVKKSNVAKSRFFAGLGLNLNKAKYTGESSFTDGTAKMGYSPILTGGLDVFSNPQIGRLIYRLELSVLMNSGDFSSSENNIRTHSFKQYSAVFAPQVLYNFYNTDRLKFYVSAGAGLMVSKYSKNISTTYYPFNDALLVEENKVELQPFNFSPQASAGIVLNKKIQISAGYSFETAISNYVYYNVSMQRTSIVINYFFNKK
nr:hypothetical protein [uncultured Pedobacter sp.]